jgi:predicted nuclease of predicted toxin-antitoxin system
MRIVIDEDIPSELVPLFRAPGLVVQHVEDIGLKGSKNGDLLSALSGNCDILVTGDTNLGRQQNLRRFDLAIVLIHPHRLVVDQIEPLIPLAIAASPTARRHDVTTIGVPMKSPRR